MKSTRRRIALSVRSSSPRSEERSNSRIVPERTGAVRPQQSNGNAQGGDPNFMTSLARGLAVVCAFSDYRRSLTIPEISEATGFSRAAVRRCLYTLAELGYVSPGPRTFDLEPKVLELGHAYLASTPLVPAAQPILDRLCEAVRESCSVSILDGTDILYVARSSNTVRILSVDLGVGSRLPAYCTAMGRVLLAFQSEARLREYFAEATFTACTKRTLTSPRKLMEELGEVRKQGYAIVDQELEIGLRSISVPVKAKANTVIAAMNVGTQAARVSIAELQERIHPELQKAAHHLSILLR